MWYKYRDLHDSFFTRRCFLCRWEMIWPEDSLGCSGCVDVWLLHMMYDIPYINTARGDWLHFLDLTPMLLFKKVSNLNCYSHFHLVNFFTQEGKLKSNWLRKRHCVRCKGSVWILLPICTPMTNKMLRKPSILQQINKKDNTLFCSTGLNRMIFNFLLHIKCTTLI